MAAARHVATPGYAALVLRRTFRELSQPGALIPMAREWWSGTRAAWNEQAKRWTFPSGATVTFGYLDGPGDVYQYQGPAFQVVIFDELTQFDETSYRYLFSRQRRPAGSTLPLAMRSASNPGGVGHEWVKARFITAPAPDRVFIPSKLQDNPHIDRVAYETSLAHLDPVTRAQLLEGDWDAVAGGRFLREWFPAYDVSRMGDYLLGDTYAVPVRDCWRFLTCDPAASAVETAKTDDPDYTVVCAWAVTPRGDLVWVDCDRFRAEIPDIVPRLESMWALHSPVFAAVETVAANRAVYQLACRTRMSVRSLEVKARDKLVRATPAMILASRGRVWVPRSAHWLDDALGELLRFKGDGRGHDDVVDNLSMGAEILSEYDGADDDAMPIALRR